MSGTQDLYVNNQGSDAILFNADRVGAGAWTNDEGTSGQEWYKWTDNGIDFDALGIVDGKSLFLLGDFADEVQPYRFVGVITEHTTTSVTVRANADILKGDDSVLSANNGDYIRRIDNWTAGTTGCIILSHHGHCADWSFLSLETALKVACGDWDDVSDWDEHTINLAAGIHNYTISNPTTRCGKIIVEGYGAIFDVVGFVTTILEVTSNRLRLNGITFRNCKNTAVIFNIDGANNDADWFGLNRNNANRLYKCWIDSCDGSFLTYNTPVHVNKSIISNCINMFGFVLTTTSNSYNQTDWWIAKCEFTENTVVNCYEGFKIPPFAIITDNIFDNINQDALVGSEAGFAWEIDRNKYNNCGFIAANFRDPKAEGTPPTGGASSTLTGDIDDVTQSIGITANILIQYPFHAIMEISGGGNIEYIRVGAKSGNNIIKCERGFLSTAHSFLTGHTVKFWGYVWDLIGETDDLNLAAVQAMGRRIIVPPWTNDEDFSVNDDDSIAPLYIDQLSGIYVLHKNSVLIADQPGGQGRSFALSPKGMAAKWNITDQKDNTGWYDPDGAFESHNRRIYMTQTNAAENHEIYSPVIDLSAIFPLNHIGINYFEDSEERAFNFRQESVGKSLRYRKSDTSFSQDPAIGPAWSELAFGANMAGSGRYIQIALTARSDGIA